jgi:hypothetical protein
MRKITHATGEGIRRLEKNTPAQERKKKKKCGYRHIRSLRSLRWAHPLVFGRPRKLTMVV